MFDVIDYDGGFEMSLRAQRSNLLAYTTGDGEWDGHLARHP